MKIRLNDDKELVEKIRIALRKTGNHCPCRAQFTDETLCPCKEFRENTPVGETCYCGLYIKEEM